MNMRSLVTAGFQNNTPTTEAQGFSGGWISKDSALLQIEAVDHQFKMRL